MEITEDTIKKALYEWLSGDNHPSPEYVEKATESFFNIINKINKTDAFSHNQVDLDGLIEKHWKYVRDMLKAHKTVHDEQIVIAEYHYRTAFAHGWKHAENYINRETIMIK
jgi:hypothetical protein